MYMYTCIHMHASVLHVAHNGRHDKVLVHESIPVVVAFKHLKVCVGRDFSTYGSAK